MLGIDSKELEKYTAEGAESRRSLGPKEIIEVSKILSERMKRGEKLITFGNGGSIADAQHFAAEMSGKKGGHSLQLPSPQTLLL